MKRVVTLVGMVSLLSGCASSQAPSSLVGRAETNPQACAPLSQEQELSLNLAQKTADEGRLHAALANLERLPADLPQARLSKARILRSLNRPEAGELYASLVDSCLKAQGEHGLGQLASAQGRHEEALSHLRLAASLDPTSDTIRNDLGVVYMNLGRMEEARFELLTALELNEAERQPALNLLTLLIYQGRVPQADALAERMGFSASQLRTAQERANALRGQLGGETGAAGQGAPAVAPRAAPAAPAAQRTPIRPVEARVASMPIAETRVAALAAAPARALRPAVSPTVSQAPKVPGVPAPQLSNFRPAPVVPLSVASAAARLPAPSALPAPAPAAASVASAPAAARVISTTAPTVAAVSGAAPVAAAAPAPSQPRQVAAVAPVATQPPAPAAAPVASAPAAARVISATAPTAPAVSGAAPVVAAAPAPSQPRQVAAVAPVATQPPVLADAPVAPAPAAPMVATNAASPRHNLIEMRPGRLIVPDDGGFVRVEPLSTN